MTDSQTYSSTQLATLSPVITTSSQMIIGENKKRLGLWLYNNSSNTIYIAFSSPAATSVNVCFQIAAFNTWYCQMPVIWRGPVFGIRNAGTGRVLCTEFLQDP